MQSANSLHKVSCPPAVAQCLQSKFINMINWRWHSSGLQLYQVYIHYRRGGGWGWPPPDSEAHYAWLDFSIFTCQRFMPGKLTLENPPKAQHFLNTHSLPACPPICRLLIFLHQKLLCATPSGYAFRQRSWADGYRNPIRPLNGPDIAYWLLTL